MLATAIPADRPSACSGRVVSRLAARTHGQRHEDGEREEAEARVETGGERGERAGERDMRQRVGGEDLGAQHEEVPDQSGGERDGRAGEERVLHERVREHHATLLARDPAAPPSRRVAAASTYPPNASVVSQKPIGYGE